MAFSGKTFRKPAQPQDSDSLDGCDKAHARCQQVLDAAARCFRELGFRGASIQRISEMAGMSPGHIYHYFRNKEAIVVGIVERNLEETLERVRRMSRIAERDGVLQACIAGVDQGIELRAKEGAASLYLEILAEATRNPAIAASLREADQRTRNETCGLLRQLPSLRRLPQAELAARVAVLSTLFDGLIIRTLLDPSLDCAATRRVIRRVVRNLLESTETGSQGLR